MLSKAVLEGVLEAFRKEGSKETSGFIWTLLLETSRCEKIQLDSIGSKWIHIEPSRTNTLHQIWKIFLINSKSILRFEVYLVAKRQLFEICVYGMSVDDS